MRHSRFMLARPCPCCMQGVSLHLLACPLCRRVIAACDEAGCVFDPKNLVEIGDSPCDVWYSTTTRCPYCRRDGEFNDPTPQEVAASGLAERDLSSSSGA
jgi:hypothetical protein